MIPRALILASLASAGVAHADYATNFGGPPFAPDATVIGVDVWQPRLASLPLVPESARAVLVRWNDYKPAMMLKGANLKAQIPPAKGPTVTVKFDLALTFPENKATRQFRIGFGGTPIGEFFMDLGDEGGLGCQADGSGRDGSIVLKKSEVAINSFYSCSAVVDYGARTHEIRITGVKRDGSPFAYHSGKLPFPAEFKVKQSDYIYLITGPVLTSYLANLSVRSE